MAAGRGRIIKREERQKVAKFFGLFFSLSTVTNRRAGRALVTNSDGSSPARGGRQRGPPFHEPRRRRDAKSESTSYWLKGNYLQLSPGKKARMQRKRGAAATAKKGGKGLLPFPLSLSLDFPSKNRTLRSGAGDHQGDCDRGEEEAGESHCTVRRCLKRRRGR